MKFTEEISLVSLLEIYNSSINSTSLQTQRTHQNNPLPPTPKMSTHRATHNLQGTPLKPMPNRIKATLHSRDMGIRVIHPSRATLNSNLEDTLSSNLKDTLSSNLRGTLLRPTSPKLCIHHKDKLLLR